MRWFLNTESEIDMKKLWVLLWVVALNAMGASTVWAGAQECEGISSPARQDQCHADLIEEMELPIAKFYKGHDLVEVFKEFREQSGTLIKFLNSETFFQEVGKVCQQDLGCIYDHMAAEYTAIKNKQSQWGRGQIDATAEIRQNLAAGRIPFHSDSEFMTNKFGASQNQVAPAWKAQQRTTGPSGGASSQKGQDALERLQAAIEEPVKIGAEVGQSEEKGFLERILDWFKGLWDKFLSLFYSGDSSKDSDRVDHSYMDDEAIKTYIQDLEAPGAMGPKHQTVLYILKNEAHLLKKSPKLAALVDELKADALEDEKLLKGEALRKIPESNSENFKGD